MNKEMEDEYWKLKTEKVVQKLRSMEWKKEEKMQKEERRRSEAELVAKNTPYPAPYPSMTATAIGLAGAAIVCEMTRRSMKKVNR